ncbi:hypothetical protein [Streptomyces sp. NPDC003480]
MKGRLALGAVVGLVVIGTVSANANRVDREKATRNDNGTPPSLSAGRHPGSMSGHTGGDTSGRAGRDTSGPGGAMSGRTGGDGGAPGTPRATAP